MSDQFLGEIRLVGFNFAPTGWALAQGQVMAIPQNTALFSLLGTMYGGNGKSTFALPNLQGNVVVGAGQGPGLSAYAQGQTGGAASVTLQDSEVPVHTHAFLADARDASSPSPGGNALASATNGANIYYSGTGGTKVQLNSGFLTSFGGSQPHENMMPYLTLNWVIALQGIYPSRN